MKSALAQISNYLKNRWGLTSTGQILIVMAVFAVTGFTAVYVRHFVFGLLGIVGSDPLWLKVLLWIVIMIPAYYVFLLIYGAIFGQFAFFWGFFKKTVKRFAPGRQSS